MKINLTVSNEHHVQLVSSMLHNLRDSVFNDVTLVCSDGQLRVNGLTLALLLPAPYRSLHLEEGALLHLPQHKVQELWSMVVTDGQDKVQWQKQEVWQDLDNVQSQEKEIVTDADIKDIQPNTEVKNIVGIKFPDNKTEPSKEFYKPFYEMEELETNEDVEYQPEIFDHKEKVLTSVEWLKGNNVLNSENPGKLIINSTAKFIYNKTCGDIIHFHCSCKKSHKCKAKAKVVKVDGEGDKIRYEVVSVDKIEKHSHIPSRGKLLAEKMINEMEVECAKEVSKKTRVVASEIRKSVQRKYKIQYEGRSPVDDTVWNECVMELPDDANIDRNLNKLKSKLQGTPL